MLEAMSRALCDELISVGINAVAAYPNEEICRDEAVVSVCLKGARVSGGAYGDYLGYDGSEELYGLMCDAKFELGIYSDTEGGYAALSRECDRLIAAVWDLSGGCTALQLGGCEYDRNLCCLRCKCQLEARFWLAREPYAEDEISEFTVKGMILHGNE